MKKNMLKEIREEKKLTQDELAKMLDIRQGQISKYESGLQMQENTIKKICKTLEISADYLLGLVEEKKDHI